MSLPLYLNVYVYFGIPKYVTKILTYPSVSHCIKFISLLSSRKAPNNRVTIGTFYAIRIYIRIFQLL